MLAMQCDYRIMTNNPKMKIGLNETQLGIAAPFWLGELLVRLIGIRQGEMALSLGTLFTSEEALAKGLVDELLEKEDVLPAAYKHAAKWGAIPEKARLCSKMLVRHQYIEELKKARSMDTKWFADYILDEGVQKNIDGYLKALSKPKK